MAKVTLFTSTKDAVYCGDELVRGDLTKQQAKDLAENLNRMACAEDLRRGSWWAVRNISE